MTVGMKDMVGTATKTEHTQRPVHLFLDELRRQKIRLWVDGGDLCLDAPKGALTADLRMELKARKLELLATLQAINVPAPQTTIPPADRNKDLPLSYAQQRLWFLDQMEGSNATYNMPAALHLRGQLDVGALERAFNEIVQRHEILRTTFLAQDGQPTQQIAPILKIPLQQRDLRHLSLEEQQNTVEWLIAEDGEAPFDLANGPLLRYQLLRVDGGVLSPQSGIRDEISAEDETEDEYVLLVNMHHIISDGWSTAIFVQEFMALYTALVTGQPATLPPLPIQYADFAQWQREQLTGATLDHQLDHWQQALAGVPPLLDLPTDRPRPPVQQVEGSSESFMLPAALTAQLDALSRQAGMSLFVPLYTAFFILLYRYTHQDDIVVGTPIAGRTREELEPLIGFFVNTLAIRAQLSDNPTCNALLQQIHQRTLDAYAHQDLPFEQLVEALQPERTLSYAPIFQTVFAWDNQPQQALELPGLHLTPLEHERKTAKFDLVLAMQKVTDDETAAFAHIEGRLEYSTALFDATTIQRMIGHLTRILVEMVRDSNQQINELPLLDATERQQLLVDWNTTQSNYPREKSVHQLFAEQAAMTPDAIALILPSLDHEPQRAPHMTYGELNRRANQLAHHLIDNGVQPGELVAICAGRSLELIVGLLGILKAGAAYLPLEPTYPAARLDFMLEDAAVATILTQDALKSRFVTQKAAIWCLDTDWPQIAHALEGDPAIQIDTEGLAYVCYTSGSTGRPKGVCVPHRAVVRLVKETNFVTLDADETLLQFAPVPFDASTFEIWGALLNGGKLVVFPSQLPSLRELGQVLVDYEVTTLWLTAGLFHQMVDEKIDGLRTVRQMLAGGDVLSVSHVQTLLRRHKHCTVINGYGPTENTTFTCCHPMRDPDAIGATVPIGRPIANTQIYLLDDQKNPVPIGVVGELYIGGDGVARGYLNRPELTAERYLPNPFRPNPVHPNTSETLYRTGDLVRYRTDGVVEFLGRMDTQVKIRGFRIELGEIETVLADHPAVAQVVVIVREDSPGDKRLVAYIVIDPAIDPMTEQDVNARLHEYLGQKLPAYMIPSAFVVLAALPLDPNGKVNRRALPAPEHNTNLVEESVPQTPTEKTLAAIWADVLTVESVGLNDSFFELGGHSLLAVQLIARIEQAVGTRLSVATLFQHATVAELASVLDVAASEGIDAEKTDPAKTDCGAANPLLVPLQTEGDRLPLFCIPGGVGIVSYLAPLARNLGHDQPVYGLQARGLDGHTSSFATIEEMATAYLEAIQTVQPHGPYYLGGHSLGGKIAYAMAQELQRQGEKVAMVAILDTDAPTPTNQVNQTTAQLSTNKDEWMLFFVEAIEALVGQRLELATEAWPDLSTDARLTHLYERLAAIGWLPIATLDELRGMFAVFQAAFQMEYTPTDLIPTPLALFRAEPEAEWDVESMARISERQERLLGPATDDIDDDVDNRAAQAQDDDPFWGWSAYAHGDVAIYQVPGNHISMMNPPHVEVLARLLNRHIELVLTNDQNGAQL